jgi:S1-C subfamily serine protease
LAALMATALAGLWHVPVLRADAPEQVNLRRTVIVDVAERTKDAVVYISSTRIVTQRIFDDPIFEQFNLPGLVQRVPVGSLGSGFIVHSAGYVVTNNHVIDRSRQITVELLDGRKLPADLINSDPEADLAILRIHSDKPLPALQLGDSSDLMIGEPVIAVGNPLGFSHTVSSGIVSALHRDLDAPQEGVTLADLIQTDAAINPGNSGGPLLNAYGQVIGINTAIRGDAQNIGFAIPEDRLRKLIPTLMDPAVVNRVTLPMKLTEKCTITPPATLRAQVIQSGANSAVATINGRAPADLIDAYAMLLSVRAGQTVTIGYADGHTASFSAKTTSQPDAVVEARKRFGLQVEEVTPMLAAKLNLARDDGLFVDAVDSNSPAAQSKIHPGDIVFQLGQHPIRSLDDLAALLEELPQSGRVLIGVTRRDQNGFAYMEF